LPISLSQPAKKVLVTGAAGLVGQQLLKQLTEADLEVIALKHAADISFQHPRVQVKTCDILDIVCLEKYMEDVECVFHCAAIVSFEKKDKDRLLQINVAGTANVVNACLHTGVKKLIHVSSVSALGRIRPGEMINEKVMWTEETSNSVYGKSKYLGEMEVWRGIGEGLNAAIVCPSLILGGDNWHDGSSAIFKKAYEEFKWYAPGGGGFIDVRDVARAMIMLMDSNISRERFILSAENLPYRHVFDAIAKCFGKKPPSAKVTPFLSELVWRLESIKATFTGKKSLLTKETARTAMSTVYYDSSKFLQAFPDFNYTPIDETIRHTCRTLTKKFQLTNYRKI
jgi:nucleoside-diphosphate-sugar epimerase